MTQKTPGNKQRTSRRWSESEALAAAERLGQGEKVRKVLETPTLADSLRRLGLPVAGPDHTPAKTSKRGSKAAALTEQSDTAAKTSKTSKTSKQPIKAAETINTAQSAGAVKKSPKKRRGVETGPIFQSLNITPARSKWGKDWIALDFPGARLLSYNELYSILQFRKYEAFRYKKICQNVVQRALGNPDQAGGIERPYFDGPTRLTLLRVGTKGMDREALTVIFKYLTDSLKREGVIEDDNPNIIVDIHTIQGQGEPRLAMKLERLYDWEEPDVPRWTDW